MRLPADRVKQLRAFYEGRLVAVTGGAGFIGGHLCDALISLGASLRIIDDLSNSHLEHLSGLIEMEPESVRFVHGSILDDQALASAIGGAGTRVAGVQTIFHLGAVGSVPRSVSDPQRAWAVNATGSLRVLEAARASKTVQRVICASSSSVYGNDPALPKHEQLMLRPLSPYAASKAAMEHAMQAYSACYGLSTVCLRFFNVFGPRQPADSAYAAVIPAFTHALLAGKSPVIYGDGSNTRDYTYVNNPVLAMLLAGVSPAALNGQAMNIGTGDRTSLLELFRLIASLAGAPHVQPTFEPARAGDVVHSYADSTMAKTLLGYEPVTSLREGLGETVEWFKRAAIEDAS
jgi:nucleoside-diphosphate-sugar epimerase